MDGFERELLARLPLAEAALLLLSHLFEERFLDRLYDEHRGRGYERGLTFPVLLTLLTDALLRHGGSARRSMAGTREAAAGGGLPVDESNVYRKLSRLPVGLSQALLKECTARLDELWPTTTTTTTRPGVVVPACFDGLNLLALDGKTLKHVTRRLRPCRTLRGKLLGGKLLVALCLRRGVALAMAADPDGHANEVPLAGPLLERLRPSLSGPSLWVADRQFCDLGLPGLLTVGGDHFLVRHGRNVRFEADPARPPGRGVDARGRSFAQEWGWLGAASDRRRRYVRRVTLSRPGEEDVSVVTDLLDGHAYPAEALLELYLMRWGIERVFQQVTEVFELRTLIGCTPGAIVFQSSLCLLLYNLIQLVRAHVAHDGAEPVEAVSGELLFREVQEQMTAVASAGELPRVVEALRPPSQPSSQPPSQPSLHLRPVPLRERLAELMRGQWRERFRKSVRSTKHVPVKHTRKSDSGHWSVAKVLAEHRQPKRPKPPPQKRVG